MNIAKNEFRFYTSLDLVELTGQRANNVNELLEIIRNIDGSSIFYHTHRYFREHHFIRNEYSSDFAQWTFDSLQEMELGEKLASIDILEYPNVRSIREAIIKVIEKYIKSGIRIRNIPSGREFHFCKLISVIMPTNYVANNLNEFIEALKKISINSLYFHLFEARLRLEQKTNDFSRWIGEGLGNTELAKKIDKLDPYTHTLDELRDEIISIIQKNSKI